MKERTVKIYYCDFCKTHRHTRQAMIDHEERCFNNPARVCPVCYGQDNLPSELPELPPGNIGSAEEKFVSLIEEHVDFCPACTLSAIKQMGFCCDYDYHGKMREWDRDRQEWR